MKYKILKEVAIGISTAVYTLEERVNKEISKGWRPIGGVCISNGVACQAMVKEEK